MNRRQLQLILELSARIVPDATPVVLGSQAILGSYPEAELPAPATMSMEADIAFLHDPDRSQADLVDSVLGELTPFHQENGVYAEGVHIETATLPEGWRERLIGWTNTDGVAAGWLLEKHDLAVSKLTAGRPKDHAFVAALIEAGLLDLSELAARLSRLPPATPAEVVERGRAFVEHYLPPTVGVDLAAITAIASAAEGADGAAPLDEATWLSLRADRGIRVWERDNAVATLAGAELNLVVHPHARGRGLGGALLDTVLAETGGAEVHAWSHSDHPAAARLAQTRGFDRVRELWVMRRPTSRRLPELVLPEGLTIRGYSDEDAPELLRVNALAFAAHPEQGAMDAANLAARMAEPWFDPRGLLVAQRDGRMVAFHWTKQHDARLGEVYVVGVDPAEQGHGLGRLVTLAGLHHLHGLGVEEVLLYVEADNAPAITVYADKLGFTHAPEDTHVMYLRGLSRDRPLGLDSMADRDEFASP